MTGLRDNLASLKRLRADLEAALGTRAPTGSDAIGAAAPRLHETSGFGSNPGQLRMFLHVPEGLTSHPALVVCLHGCTQTAASYDAGSGWSALAGQNGFVALFPQQQAQNNPNCCFTWYAAEDTRRDCGEALSIKQMIDHAVTAYGIDRNRIFVVGLSAGGAMASSLLAAYPETFAAGAIMAGLPHGSASNLSEALAAMSKGRDRTPQQWGDLARSASPHQGPWPRVAIWHGASDAIVNPSNAEACALQAINLHGLAPAPSSDIATGNDRVRIWRNRRNENAVEVHIIEGMGHGVPITSEGEGSCGQAGANHFDVGISSSARILSFFVIKNEREAMTDKADRISTGTQGRRQAPTELQNSIFDVLRDTGVLSNTATGRRRFPPLSREVHRIIDAALRMGGFPKK